MGTDERSRSIRVTADTIRAERAARGLTQRALAERADVPLQTYIRYETGKRDIPLARLVANIRLQRDVRPLRQGPLSQAACGPLCPDRVRCNADTPAPLICTHTDQGTPITDSALPQIDTKSDLRSIHMDSKVLYMDTNQALEQQLAAEVREAARSAGVSRNQLAELTGIPFVTLTRRLASTGKGFTVAELVAVAAALDLSLVELALRAERSLTRPPAAA